MKRSWNEAAVTALDHGFGVLLDGRPLRLPGGHALRVPGRALAGAVAAEWGAAGGAMGGEMSLDEVPLTRLVGTATDRIAPAPDPTVDALSGYGESDLLCYRAADPPELVARQAAVWDPPLAWAGARYDVHLEVATGIVHRAQPAATIARLSSAVAAYDAWHLAALSPIVTIGGSLVLALALAEGAITPDAAWAAAELDEEWQAERWGEDALAAEARAGRRRDFEAAVRFLAALKSS